MNRYRPILLIALLVALAPIWITQREMWDGVTVEYAFETGDMSGLLHAVMASGWPAAKWIYKTLSVLQESMSIPYWLGIDMLYTMALTGMAYEVYLLARQRLGWSSPRTDLLLILFLMQPIWHILMSAVHIAHMLGFWFLLLGHRLTCSKPLWTKLCGLLLVTISFQYPASIVMIFWLELMFYFSAREERHESVGRAIAVACYAVAWYVASRTIFGPTETFGGYNQLLFPTSVEAVRQIIWTGFKFCSWILVLTLPLWFGAMWRSRLVPFRAIQWAHIGWCRRHPHWVLALIGCFLAIAPYWAVGKGPVVLMPYDWTARNALPLALPLSMLIALGMQKFADAAGENGRQRREQLMMLSLFLWWFGMSLVGVAGKLYQIKLERAIESSLRSLPAPPSGFVTLQLEFDPLVRIRQLEANGLLWRAYGRAEWAVLIGPPQTWVKQIRETYVGDQAAAVTRVKSPELWKKFYVMGDLKNFDCETVIGLSVSSTQSLKPVWLNWLGWSPLQLTARQEKSSCQ